MGNAISANDITEFSKIIDIARKEQYDLSIGALSLNSVVVIFLLFLLHNIFIKNKESSSCNSKVLIAVSSIIYLIFLGLQMFCHQQIKKYFVMNNYYIMLLKDVTKYVSVANIGISGIFIIVSLFFYIRKIRDTQ